MKYLLVGSAIVMGTLLSPLNFAASATMFQSSVDSSQIFTLERVPGDGNCAFNAIGCSRAEIVTALTQHVMEYGQAERAQEVLSLLNFNSSDDAVASAVSLAETLVNNIGLYYSAHPEEETLATEASAALEAFRGQMLMRNSALFQTELDALRESIRVAYADRYDGFNVALISELMESGLSIGQLDTPEQIVAAIERVFARNAGVASWLPVGLIFGVSERLNLDLAVWSTRGAAAGQVVLYQTNALTDEGWRAGVRHVVWHGNHYDRLHLNTE